MRSFSMPLLSQLFRDSRASRWFVTVIVVCILSISSTASYNVTVTIGEPYEVQRSGQFLYVGVETFDKVSAGFHATYESTFGFLWKSPIKGTYSNLTVRDHDYFGGAGGIGKYPAISQGQPCRLLLTQARQPEPNYFGLLITELGRENRVRFYYNRNHIYTLDTAALYNAVGDHIDYYSYPIGKPQSEASVFVHFYFKGTSFNAIDFIEETVSEHGARFESDNHSIGFSTNQVGKMISEVVSEGVNQTVTTNTTTTKPITAIKDPPIILGSSIDDVVILNATDGHVPLIIAICLGSAFLLAVIIVAVSVLPRE